jgi:hypothetical protein
MTTCTLSTVKRGDTWSFIFVWRQDNTIIDLTGASARMQLRERRTKELVASISTDDSIIIEGAAGKITANFPPILTKLVEAGQYVTDIEVTFTDGSVVSSQTVQLSVEEDVTI